MINVGVWLSDDAYYDLSYFDINNSTYNRDNCQTGYYEGFVDTSYEINYKSLHTIQDKEELDAVMFFCIPTTENHLVVDILSNSRIKKYSFIAENPQVDSNNHDLIKHEVFDGIFTWYKYYVDMDDKKYRFVLLPIYKDDTITHDTHSKDYLCSIICGLHPNSGYPFDGYGMRIDCIKWFENNKPDDLLFYGCGWDAVPKFSRLYRGQLVTKKPVYNASYFNICYESNYSFEGFITEKIFDSFMGGCVPIYLGAPDISDYIPENCYIDRRKYDSNESLYEDLLRIKDTSYNDYIENINKFMKSEDIYKFTYKALFETFNNKILEDFKIGDN